MAQASPAPNAAEAYERFIAQNVFVPWTADLISRARPKKGDRVLDLACGTGIVARHVGFHSMAIEARFNSFRKAGK